MVGNGCYFPQTVLFDSSDQRAVIYEWTLSLAISLKKITISRPDGNVRVGFKFILATCDFHATCVSLIW